jgi:tetratricopeptide (TPR) repeat protein
MARLDYIGGRSDEALRLARSLLERFPDSGEAHALVAGLLRATDPESSVRHEAEARRLLVSGDEAATRGEARLALALSYGESDPDAAIALLTWSLELYPWEFEALWRRAQLTFLRAQDKRAQGDGAGALAGIDDVLSDAEVMTRVREELDLVWIQQGAALLESSRISRGLAAAGGPDASAHSERAARDAERAVDALTQAVERGPSNWMSYYDRALALGHRARFAIDGGDGARAVRDLEAAIADLDRAIEIESRREFHMQKRRLLHSLGRYEQALAAVDRAIEIEDGWEARFYRATALRLSRRFEEALEDVGRAIDGALEESGVDARRMAELYEQRADLSWMLGRHEQAAGDAAEAVALDPNRSTAHVVLGKAAVSRGDATAMAKHFDDALRTAPGGNRWIIQLERGVGYWKLERLDLARRDFVAYTESGDPWIRLWIWELERLRGDRAAAGRALEEAARSGDPKLMRVVSAIRGEIRPEELTGELTGESLLYALYYLGVNAFVDGRNEDAARWFDECRGLGYDHYMEHDLAGWHLARMTEAG